LESLSDIELYYSPYGIVRTTSKPNAINGEDEIIIDGEDFAHAARVMRHKAGDTLFVTDGKGNIYESVIKIIGKDSLTAGPVNTFRYENTKNNLFFCIPKLKNPDRFEFALEKCVEFGITNFVIYESNRTVPRGDKLIRWNKILISAMKQSLRSYLPALKTVSSLKEIFTFDGEKIGFEQKAENNQGWLKTLPSTDYYFVFGPEGGLDNEELGLFNPANLYNIAENRLRSETAIIKAASLL
jgi:16S rRNA (uracil1498-N3)-methyltransferase